MPALLCAVLLPGCHGTKESPVPSVVANKQEYAVQKSWVEATVIDYSEVSGCAFLLMLSDGSKLQPKNLGEAFRKDALKVMVSYVIEDEPNTCMAGKKVRINGIRKSE